MHLLHLLEPFCDSRVDRVARISGTDAAASGAAMCIGSQSYHTQATIVVGPRRAEIRAHQLGIKSYDTVCPIAGSSRHGVALIKRVLGCRTAPERVIAWSTHLESWASRLEIEALCPWKFGISEIDVRVQTASSNVAERQHIRARLGIPQDSLVIAMADDPSIEADLWSFISILAMLESGGIRVSGIAPRAAAQRGRARRFFRSLGLSQGLHITGEPIWSLSDAIDIAYVGPGMWAKARELGEPTPDSASELRWARLLAAERMLQRGVPTVTTDELSVPPSLRAALVSHGKTSALAGRLMALAESSKLRQDVSQALHSGTVSHAGWLANQVLWHVTAMPSDLNPNSAAVAMTR